MDRMLFSALLTALLLNACVVAPAHRGPVYVVAPALPLTRGVARSGLAEQAAEAGNGLADAGEAQRVPEASLHAAGDIWVYKCEEPGGRHARLAGENKLRTPDTYILTFIPTIKLNRAIGK